MKYQYEKEGQPLTAEQRAEQNILALKYMTYGGSDYMRQYVFNSYTGIGGLSGEKFSQHANFASYTAAKKEYENGQFFTPPAVIENILDNLKIQVTDRVLDPTCGRGDFFNFCPVEENCTGVELEANAAKVAAYLYPKATIINSSILEAFEGQFDVALCNPPFNLRWYYQGKERPSQEAFILRLAPLLKPASIVVLIVPSAWLNDELFYGNTISLIAESFAFISGYELPKTAFKAVGVDSFATKVLFFQRLGAGVAPAPYAPAGIKSFAAAIKAAQGANSYRIAKTSTIARELFQKNALLKNEGFAYKTAKLLYEMQAHKIYLPYYEKALALVQGFYAPKPEGVTEKEWEKSRPTEKSVLSKIKRFYAQAEKEHAKKLRAQKLGVLVLESPDAPSEPISKKSERSAKKLRAKERGYERTRTPFEKMEICPVLEAWIKKHRFIGGKGTVCQFNELQAHDLNLFLQKRYALAAWEQGSGKTGVGHAWGKFLLEHKLVDKAFVVSPALAIKKTWKDHLTRNGVKYKQVETAADVFDKNADFLTISFDSLTKRRRKTYKVREKDPKTGKKVVVEKTANYTQKIYAALRECVKLHNGRVAVIVDESDEMTNSTTGKTRNAFAAFQHCRYKLLTTGTATRNNIAELYSQLQFMYNNSPAFTNDCEWMYEQDKDGDIIQYMNIDKSQYSEGDIIQCNKKPKFKRGLPFSHKYGQGDFKACFNPAKATVLGIKKQNQDVYNSEELKKICSYAMITRTFNDVAGEGKYSFKSHIIPQTWQEAALYEEIFAEVRRLIAEFGYATGNERKDAALRIQYQMRMLIDACSKPHTFPGFRGGYGAKVGYITDFCCKTDKPILLGCTTIEAAKTYQKELTAKGKVVFLGTGETSFAKRGKISEQFQKTKNAVLVCTQQAFKSSINIPECNLVVCESLQWNLPKLAQFYFRCIRFDSTNPTQVHFFLMENSIEENLMALLMDKQRLNDFVKTGELKTNEELCEGMELQVFKRAITKTVDEDKKVNLSWGKATNDGVGKVNKETGKFEGKFVPYFAAKNKAGQEVIGIAQSSEIADKSLNIGFTDPAGNIVKVVNFAQDKLEQKTAYQFKKYLDGLRAKLEAQTQAAG